MASLTHLKLVDFDNTANEPSSPLDYALQYAAIGWQVFPVWPIRNGICACPAGGACKDSGKHPLGKIAPRGQDDATIEGRVIRQWWATYPGANIGIHLSRSGLCAVDIDPRNGGHFTMEALEDAHGPLLTDVVQLTGGGGEHRVFTKPEGLQSLPGKLGKGVDLKLNGYIVAEPSLHISGKPYLWEGSSSPLEGCAPSPLPDWIRDLARQELTKDAENTAFVSRYVTDNQIEDLRSALFYIDADDRDTWVKVGMALKTIGAIGLELWTEYSKKSVKFNAQDQHKKWLSFKPSSLNIETVFFMGKEAGWSGMPGKADVFSEADIEVMKQAAEKRKEPVKTETKTHSVAPDLFPVPVMNELLAWMEQLTERPTRSITMQGVLALVAVLSGRVYRSSNNNDSSLFLMTLAETGRGKSYPSKAVKSLLTAAGFGGMLKGAGNTSPGAIFTALRESPCHIQITDEIGKHYAVAKKQVTGQMADAFTALTTAYSECDSTLLPRNYSGEGMTEIQLSQRGNRFIVCPSITLFGFATPEQVLSNLSSDEIEDGFLNRQIIVYADDEPLPEQDMSFAPPPDHLVAWVKAMRRVGVVDPVNNMAGMNTRYDEQPTPIVVTMSSEIKARFKAFRKEADAYEGDKKKMAVRWAENALRMATGMAVADNPANPVVSMAMLEWCIRYVRHHGVRFFVLAEQNIADNEFHRLRNQVQKAVENAGGTGIRYSQLVNFCRLWRSANPSLRDQAIESLKRDELIVEVKPAPKKGRPGSPMFYSFKIIELNQ